MRTISLLASLVIALPALAAEPSAPKPPPTKMATPTELVVATACDKPTPATRKGQVNGWQASIGEWSVKEGALYGDEVAEDNHPSSCTYRYEATDMVITGMFKLGTSPQIAFGCRDNVPPNNHLGRTFITPKSFWVVHQSGISKTTKSTKLKEEKADFDPDKWYPITIEIVGDQYLARVGEHEIYVRHERFKDAKGLTALISKGQGAAFKDVTIWKAKPNPDWKSPQTQK